MSEFPKIMRLPLLCLLLWLFASYGRNVQAENQSTTIDSSRDATEMEFLPIFSYDTDVGFGYGVKVFALNCLERDESFDLTLFNSTKGERWYRLVFSVPDFETRQGTEYRFAVDVSIDYDKWIAYNFFGIGNGTRYEDKETYTREPLDVSLILSRGFTRQVVGQVGVRYKAVRNFNFSEGSRLIRLQPAPNASRASFVSIFSSVRYDTRSSFVNPSSGLVLSGEVEVIPDVEINDVGFTRIAVWLQGYRELLHCQTVLAFRLGLQGLIGDNLPVQVLLPVGGNNTLRGAPQDRFLDKVAAVGNLEFRFPIYWRFGGVIGFDVGKVWHRLAEVDLRRWATNPTIGLRFYMDTFVVRLDVGLGRETTGFYLNFGHIF